MKQQQHHGGDDLRAAVASLRKQHVQQVHRSVSSSSSSGRSLQRTEIESLRSTGCSVVDDDWDHVRLLLLLSPPPLPPTSSSGSDDDDGDNNNNNNNARNNVAGMETYDASALLRRYVSNTTFGPNVLLVFRTTTNTTTTTTTSSSSTTSTSSVSSSALPTMIRSSVPFAGCHRNGYVRDSVLDCDTGYYWYNRCIADTVCRPDTALIGCGIIAAASPSSPSSPSPPSSSFGRLRISVGPETGGQRVLHLPPDATMKTVTDQLTNRTKESKETQNGGETQQQQQHSTSTSSSSSWSLSSSPPPPPLNILFAGSYICHTPHIDTVVLHAGANVRGATTVARTVLFPVSSVAHGASVTDCVLQWNATVQHHSTVQSVFFMECATIGPNSYCTQSVLGPDAHASAGEIHATVLGPNTNAHHQSLCIGVLWPHGRGNIGYGANVGSNHTGRLPDQEVVAPEGCFWGLGTVIVMPCNLNHSPYCIVAAGTTLSPQRIAVPFALIQNGAVVPGWVYAKSPYTVVRSAHKYATRRKARYHAHYTGWNILRPSVVQMCVTARRGLLSSPFQQQGKGSITSSSSSSSVVGTLKCDERARQLGIRTYTDLIQRYALQELLRLCLDGSPDTIVSRVTRALSSSSSSQSTIAAAAAATNMSPPESTVEWAPFPWDEDPTQEVTYQQNLLLQEFPPAQHQQGRGTGVLVSKHWIRVGLERLGALETQFTTAVRNSKARDDVRGAAIIPDYAAAHVAADDDPVIVRQNEVCESVHRQIRCVLGHLPAASRL